MQEQLPLQFDHRSAVSFKNFVVGPNQHAILAARQLITNEAWDFVYLWGGEGFGKTHLLQSVCSTAASQGVRVCYFDVSEIVCGSPEIFENIEQFQLIVLDNLDAIAGHLQWEEACFNCYNRLQLNERSLLVSAHNPPGESGIQLPDLTSRLQAGVVFSLKPLSDEQKIDALKRRAADRGLELSDEVGSYLINHYDRSLTQLIKMLDELDRAALVNKRKLTVPFVKDQL